MHRSLQMCAERGVLQDIAHMRRRSFVHGEGRKSYLFKGVGEASRGAPACVAPSAHWSSDIAIPSVAMLLRPGTHPCCDAPSAELSKCVTACVVGLEVLVLCAFIVACSPPPIALGPPNTPDQDHLVCSRRRVQPPSRVGQNLPQASP